jgi:hypothetical protein
LNPFGVGATITIRYGENKKQYAEMYPTRGIFSSVEHLFHFGLGQINHIDHLEVRWPDGQIQEVSNIKANQKIILQEKDANPIKTGLLSETGISFNPNFSEQKNVLFDHVENDFNDFETWPLNPWKESELGPFMAEVMSMVIK